MGAQMLLSPGPHPQPTGEKDSMLETTCLAPIHQPPQNRHPRERLGISKPQSSNGSQMRSGEGPTAPRGPTRLASVLTALLPATGPLYMLFPRLIRSQGEGLVLGRVPSPQGLAGPQGAQAAGCRALMTSLAALTCSSGLVSARLLSTVLGLPKAPLSRGRYPPPPTCSAAPLASVWS
ncbi:unnamed protein product [Rangifer tarandus platyrhynchus]|uniref:Uncharacterized protein n=1 Tax=Rangifer tarandus platyrhynchus TaxID=3082113 RepID=A0ABN8ZII9_RANTA|nr:unnamed protein product [Rangifer tarandus platyrhynchus]